MLTSDNVSSFIDWYCSLRGEKNRGQYQLNIIQEFTGSIRYYAQLTKSVNNVSESNIVHYSSAASSSVAAVCFIVLAAVKAKEANYQNDSQGYSPTKIVFDMMQDPKLGGEAGMIVEAIGHLV